MAPFLPPCRWHLVLDLLIPASPMSTLRSHNHHGFLSHIPSEVHFLAAVVGMSCPPGPSTLGREQICGGF